MYAQNTAQPQVISNGQHVTNNQNQNDPHQNDPVANVVEVEPLKFDPSTKTEVNARNAEMRKISDEVTIALGETPDFFYCMSTGYVLIINNEKFSDPEAERKGRQADSIAVSKLFKDILGWHVETRKDISAQQMKKEMQKISKCQDFPYSALFVFVFSHGDEKGVRGSDSEQAVSIVDDLLENFKGSESFNKVPKFFVVQASRGRNTDIASDSPRKEVPSRLPTLTDFMIAHASPPGYEAMSIGEHGSWFIQEFVALTEKYYAFEDIVSIFNRVNFKVANKFKPTLLNQDGVEFQKIEKSQPCFEVALRRRCFFAKYFERAYKQSNVSHNPPSQNTARKISTDEKMASEEDENEGSLPASLEENLKIEMTNQGSLPASLEENLKIEITNQGSLPASLEENLKIEITNQVFTTTTKPCEESTEFLYSMNTGFVLVINNVKFGGSNEERIGSGEDVKKIKGFFEVILGWKVIVKDDLEASEIEQEVTNTSQCKDFPYKALFIFIFTHGSQQGVHGVNNAHVKVQSLVDKFKTTNAEEFFWEIPKFFVIQACRGDKQDLPQPDGQAVPSRTCHDKQDLQKVGEVPQRDGPNYLNEDVNMPPRRFLPQMSNFLVAHPCLEGYEALRSMTEGSWFIQEFFEVTHQFYKTEDIVSIFSRVNFKVSNKECEEQWKQMPIYEVGLRQRCFFTRDVSDDEAVLDGSKEGRNVQAVQGSENVSRTSELVTLDSSDLEK